MEAKAYCVNYWVKHCRVWLWVYTGVTLEQREGGGMTKSTLKFFGDKNEILTSDLPFLSPQKERTERLVINPLNQLLSMFTGPHKLVQKRFDKLLDFYNCTERAEKLKDKKTLEELQSARNNYEALNAQLLDELPKFQQYAQSLFTNCIHGYAEAHCDFVQQALEQLQPLLSVRPSLC